MRIYRFAAVLALVVGLGACGVFDAPDQNAGTLSDLTKGTPTRLAVNTGLQGLLGSVTGTNAGIRNEFGTQASTLGILGREGYNLDVSNPQNVPTFYSAPAGASFHTFTNGQWTQGYATLAQANVLFAAIDQLPTDPLRGMSANEKDAAKGFIQTVKALQLFWLIRQLDVSGAALDALSDPTAAPPPIASRDAVYNRILGLLDSAQTHLTAAGGTTPLSFAMPAGWAPFSTAGTFSGFNRGVRAKVNVTWATVGDPNATAKYTAALTDLGGSFLDVTKPMSFGAYHSYSTISGDVLNPLYDPTSRQRYAHRWFADSAQLKAPAGAKDNRVSKVTQLADTVSRFGFIVDWSYNLYNSPSSPAPVLKNEDLVLLRAEAKYNTGDLSGAIADINVVRVQSGGLPPLTDPYVQNVALGQPPTLLDDLLYERQYSLVWENGDRWVDLRRYGLLSRLPVDRAPPNTFVTSVDIVWPYLIIPTNECLPRGTSAPAGCTAVPTAVAGTKNYADSSGTEIK